MLSDYPDLGSLQILTAEAAHLAAEFLEILGYVESTKAEVPYPAARLEVLLPYLRSLQEALMQVDPKAVEDATRTRGLDPCCVRYGFSGALKKSFPSAVKGIRELLREIVKISRAFTPSQPISHPCVKDKVAGWGDLTLSEALDELALSKEIADALVLTVDWHGVARSRRLRHYLYPGQARAICTQLGSEAELEILQAAHDRDRAENEAAPEQEEDADPTADEPELVAAVPPPVAPQHQEEPQAERSAERPPQPTHAYCLIPPNTIRWITSTSVEQRLWHLFGCLLRQQNWPVPFDVIEKHVWSEETYFEASPKRVQNALSDLKPGLETIRFPWTFRTSNRKVYKG